MDIRKPLITAEIVHSSERFLDVLAEAEKAGYTPQFFGRTWYTRVGVGLILTKGGDWSDAGVISDDTIYNLSVKEPSEERQENIPRYVFRVIKGNYSEEPYKNVFASDIEEEIVRHYDRKYSPDLSELIRSIETKNVVQGQIRQINWGKIYAEFIQAKNIDSPLDRAKAIYAPDRKVIAKITSRIVDGGNLNFVSYMPPEK